MDMHGRFERPLPVRAQNGEARIQNTENLLEKISSSGKAAPPIIILSDYIVENDLEKMVDVMRLAMSLGRNGAVDIIGKPFPKAGRTLDRVIKKVLGIRNKASRKLPILPLPAMQEQHAGQYVTADDGDADGWLTVTQAAKLLTRDVPGLDMAKARSRISTAAGREEFEFDGDRKSRRIEPGSFALWRIEQRDRDLDDEDDDGQAA